MNSSIRMRVSFLHLALAAPAMSLLLPPTHEEKVLIAEKHQSNAVTADGKTTCPPRLLSMCCDSLDYSGFQVECVGRNELILQSRAQIFELMINERPGPGKVDYLEKCLEYESRPMCCCMYPTKPDMPHVSDDHSPLVFMVISSVEWPYLQEMFIDNVDDNNSNPRNQVPREITCDKDCNALKGPEEVKDKVIGDL